MTSEATHYQAFLRDLEAISFLKNSLLSLRLLTEQYGDEHTGLAEEVLTVAHALGWDVQEVFAQYIIDYLKEQRQFERKGEYGHDDFDKIREEILDNPEVMKKIYLPGLFLSYPMTAILFHKYSFFKRSFLPRLTGEMEGIEVGYGDGFFLWVLLKSIPGLRLTGFDISAPAREFAGELLGAAGVSADRYDLQVANVIEGLPVPDRSLDWAILAEVIEHLPNPVDAIVEVGRTLKSGGLLYVATMIDCNHMDHISNFESPEVVVALMTDNGFAIEAEFIYRVTDDLPDSRDRAVGLSYVARKL